MGIWTPMDTVRDLRSPGILPPSDTTVTNTDSSRSWIQRIRPGLRPGSGEGVRSEPQSGVGARARASDSPTMATDPQPPPSSTPRERPSSQSSPTPPPETPSASSTARVELGSFSIYQLIQGSYQETTALNRPRVSVEIPTSWRASNGQIFDSRGNKIGEIGPGVLAYVNGTTCESLPTSEMDGPPEELYGFSFDTADGIYQRTASFCGGGIGTYSGDCHIHTYCVQPDPGGFGLVMTFLELSPTTREAQLDLYDDVVDSIRIRP